MSFNIFKVLEKDDKELIHSSFIKYLLENYGCYFYKYLFNLEHDNYKTPELEKSYEKQRLDIEIISNDNKEIVVIENKFKTFPHKEQLKRYDKILKKYHKDKKKHKFVICFDSNSLTFYNENWTFISYSEILEVINKFLISTQNISNDEKLFINHYCIFLNQYYYDYSHNLNNLKELLENPNDKISRFWLRLFYSNVQNKIEQKFLDKEVEVSFDSDTGKTSVPLVNIKPKHWKINGIEKVIQFQGNDVKFYIHTGNKEIIKQLIEKVKSNIITNNGELKKITARNENSSFIYKEKLTHVINSDVNIDNVIEYIMDFYSRIDLVIKN